MSNVLYDPYKTILSVLCLKYEQYVQQTADENGRFFIPELGLWLGLWEGDRLGANTHGLRWWDESGNLLLWSSEKADRLAAKLRELGVDPDAIG